MHPFFFKKNRHWDTFVTNKRNNIFITYLEVVDGKYKLKTTPRNLLQNTDLVSNGSYIFISMIIMIKMINLIDLINLFILNK